jgi:hypothetical protein
MTCLPVSDAPAAFHYNGPPNWDAFTIAHRHGLDSRDSAAQKRLLSENRLVFYLTLSSWQLGN